MKTVLLTIILLLLNFNCVNSQKRLTSWSQQNIENYTKEMYDKAQNLSPSQLLNKNLIDKYWSEVFLTLNASVNHHSKDTDYLRSLAKQITNKTETKLKGTSRLIIWDRISNGDIIFEGKGLVFDNDLFTVAGRANQLLQSLTKKNFGYVTINSTENELEVLKNKWLDYLTGKPVEELKPNEFTNSKMPEISGLSAVKALIISLQHNPEKEILTKKCLKNIYNLDEMPKEKSSPANYCSPDTYAFLYLGILFGDEKFDEAKNSKWWMNLWNENQNKLFWNSDKGIYELKK
ncbi:hypothetical protein [Chryseobacterium oryctis]|uniref:Uncharacterized protein n=1 Tax=Chryseobacterium oryctis TaxID=2952618 RepID=A0ABT3HPI5_9FLAO|nr:hypothetical protein [Chryseobacterium oryctis]MCW3161700.1 hypothetical protein [Chryseobacterium oryctis]